MRRTALLTVLLFLGQSLVCAHTGLGAAAVFGPEAALAAGTCQQAGAGAIPSHTAESPAQRCQRHCAQYARSVPAAAPAVHIAAPLSLPVERISFALPARPAEARRAPQRAPPRLRLLLESLQI